MFQREGIGLGFDLAGMAIGTVALEKILIGRQFQHGDLVVGLKSNGIHSNGLSLARYVFVEKQQKSLQ